jgi:sulfur-oxidizing protein SoxZ
MARTLIKVPRTAKKGEIITLSAMIAHPMETGHRRDAEGQAIPRDIIKLFTCHYGGVEVFRADMHPALAAYPLMQFSTVATASGPITFTWTDEAGKSTKETVEITVEA